MNDTIEPYCQLFAAAENHDFDHFEVRAVVDVDDGDGGTYVEALEEPSNCDGAFYGVCAISDGIAEHIADRKTLEAALKLVRKLGGRVPAVKKAPRRTMSRARQLDALRAIHVKWNPAFDNWHADYFADVRARKDLVEVTIVDDIAWRNALRLSGVPDSSAGTTEQRLEALLRYHYAWEPDPVVVRGRTDVVVLHAGELHYPSGRIGYYSISVAAELDGVDKLKNHVLACATMDGASIDDNELFSKII